MFVERRDGSRERQILTGMIVDPVVLGGVSSRWDKKRGLFKSEWSNIVAQWCVDYYNKYGKAPDKHVEGMFETWSAESKDKETVSLVSKFLTALDGEYTKTRKALNPKYVLDLAGKHFDDVRLGRMIEQLQADREMGKSEAAFDRIAKFDRVELGEGALIDLFTDQQAVKSTFLESREPIIRYPGALGDFYGNIFERDALVTFLAPEKRGKTFHLMDVAYRALLQRRKVLFLEIGDLSEAQIKNRFMARVSKRPFRRTKKGRPVKYPTAFERPSEDEPPEPTFDIREYKTALDEKTAWAACLKLMGNVVKSKSSLFKLGVYANNTMSVAGVFEIVKKLEKSSWGLPDVIVIDYADLLAPPPGYTESRDQINHNWKSLRSLSQQCHCLVVTATQANAASYKSDTLDMSNFSEDKRKWAHVTAGIIINQTKMEKEKQIQRLMLEAVRDDETGRPVYITGCLACANPTVLSTF